MVNEVDSRNAKQSTSPVFNAYNESNLTTIGWRHKQSLAKIRAGRLDQI
jgi:hypothetical protein